MQNKTKNIAIIPARGGSKRIPRRNINGTPKSHPMSNFTNGFVPDEVLNEIATVISQSQLTHH